MHVQHLDVTDPTALEAALEAAPLHTVARVTTPAGETFDLTRTASGWYLPGDVVIASADVVEGRPVAVALYGVGR